MNMIYKKQNTGQKIHKNVINKPFLTLNAQKGLGIIEFLLGILLLSVISALMVPALVNTPNNSQNQPAYNNVTANNSPKEKQLYKKAYADASQMWMQLYNDGVLKPRQGWGLDQANYDNFTQFMTKFMVIKQCSAKNNSECWASNETPDVISGHPFSSDDRCFVDVSGRSWCEAYYRGWFVVDVNGLKTPNRFGKDRFIFYTISGNDANESGIPDKIVIDSDYTTIDANKCPNPPCYYASWISGN